MVSLYTPNGTGKIEYHDNWVLGTLVIGLSLLFSLLGYVEYGASYKLSIEVIAVNLLYTIAGVITLRTIVYSLDKLYPWFKNVSIRFISQLLITLTLYLIIQSLIVYGLETESYKGPENKLTIIATYFIGILMVFLVNALYLLFYIRHRNNMQQITTESNKYLLGRKGSKRVSILSSDLMHIYIEDTLVKGIGIEGDNIVLSDNLSELEKVLDTDLYFRANRQNLIRKETIKSVTYNENKSCTVLTISKKEIIVSRHKAPSFKKWLKR